MTFSYGVDEKGQPTLDAESAKTVSYRFRMSINDWPAPVKSEFEFGPRDPMPDNWKELIRYDWEIGIPMEGMGTAYKAFGTLLSSLKCPSGFYNKIIPEK